MRSGRGEAPGGTRSAVTRNGHTVVVSGSVDILILWKSLLILWELTIRNSGLTPHCRPHGATSSSGDAQPPTPRLTGSLAATPSRRVTDLRWTCMYRRRRRQPWTV